jgi:imidazolonepropionase
VDAPVAIDLLVAGAAELATPVGTRARGGAELGEIRRIPDGAVAVRGERIVEVGPAAELRRRYAPARTVDARGGTLVPGFVDAHTHPVFAGTREAEFELRTRGRSYLEIAQAGGGILASVRGVRAAAPEELLARVLLHLARFLEHGTTTIEATSGYGLTLTDERKSLEVLAEAGRRQPVECVPTFLGAGIHTSTRLHLPCELYPISLLTLRNTCLSLIPSALVGITCMKPVLRPT